MPTSPAKPKQAAATNQDAVIDIVTQLATGTDSTSDSDGSDGTIDVTA